MLIVYLVPMFRDQVFEFQTPARMRAVDTRRVVCGGRRSHGDFQVRERGFYAGGGDHLREFLSVASEVQKWRGDAR